MKSFSWAGLALGLLVSSCSPGVVEPTASTTVTAGDPTIAVTTTTVLDVSAQIEGLIEITEQIRGLEFLEPPVVTIVTETELERRVRDDLAEELDTVEVDQAVYRLLGLVEPDTDLAELYLDLYGEQVAGFYDGETKELVVPAHPEGFTPLQKSTLIHELTHALTDQHFGMWDTYQGLLDAEKYDEAAAMLSIIEGDAVLSEVLYIQGLPVEEQDEIVSASLQVDTTALDAAPAFIRDSLVFPYTTGFEFVLEEYVAWRTAGRDRLYTAAPGSTEQVIDGVDDPPLVVEPTDVTLDGYTEESDGSWGALSWKLIFDQMIGGDHAAVSGWGGDRSIVLSDGSRVVLAIDYRGDRPADAGELEVALERYLTTVYGAPVASDTYSSESGWAAVRVEGDRLLLVVADDPGAGETVFAQFD